MSSEYDRVVEIRRTFTEYFHCSRKEIVDGIQSPFDQALLVLSLMDKLNEHYSNELSAHSRYYAEFLEKQNNGTIVEHEKGLLEWQRQNKEALETLLSDLADMRSKFIEKLVNLEKFHVLRGFKEGTFPWNYYKPKG